MRPNNKTTALIIAALVDVAAILFVPAASFAELDIKLTRPAGTENETIL